MDIPAWIPENNFPSGVMFLCPYCRKKVYYHHGSTSAAMRKSGVIKHCLYRFCPWCGKEVAEYFGKITVKVVENNA